MDRQHFVMSSFAVQAVNVVFSLTLFACSSESTAMQILRDEKEKGDQVQQQLTTYLNRPNERERAQDAMGLSQSRLQKLTRRAREVESDGRLTPSDKENILAALGEEARARANQHQAIRLHCK